MNKNTSVIILLIDKKIYGKWHFNPDSIISRQSVLKTAIAKGRRKVNSQAYPGHGFELEIQSSQPR